MSDIGEKFAELEKETKKRTEQLLYEAEIQVRQAIEGLKLILRVLPPEARKKLLNPKVVAEIQDLIGTKVETGTGKVETKRTRTTDEEILKYLSSERTTSEILAFFQKTAPFSNARLMPLLKKKKVTMKKSGNKKLWKVV